MGILTNVIADLILKKTDSSKIDQVKKEIKKLSDEKKDALAKIDNIFNDIVINGTENFGGLTFKDIFVPYKNKKI